MRFLLDSHTLLWAVFERRRLSPRVLQILEDDESDLSVSVVTLWELAVKVGTGKLQLPGSSTVYLLEQMERIGASLLPVKPTHVRRLESLPQHPEHRDPWDRMLVAQAMDEQLTLLSRDRKMHLYDVPVIWK